jgi:uncharacterized protein
MRWHDLLFAHWPIEPARLRPFVPPGLVIETFDGAAWLGIVPFRMSGIRHRLLPPIPGLSAFPELNVRTYVHAASDPGAPGVWFFSLDATSRVAVRVARATYRLAYMEARMSCTREGDDVVYDSERRGPHTSLACGEALTPHASFAARYGPRGPVFEAAPGSLVSFLTDRYRLFAWREGRLYRAEIDHAIWPLQEAEATISRNTMGEALGIPSTEFQSPPLLHFARDMDVVAWMPEEVAT